MTREANGFSAVKVFSATKPDERAQLGDHVTAWLAEHPTVRVVDVVVTQSSDQAFHCLAITLFYDDSARTRS